MLFLEFGTVLKYFLKELTAAYLHKLLKLFFNKYETYTDLCPVIYLMGVLSREASKMFKTSKQYYLYSICQTIPKKVKKTGGPILTLTA